jgi:hypothetical protein
MAREGEDPRRLNCPSCGALLQPELEDQFFCEYCGSPLPDLGQGEYVSRESEDSGEVPTGEAAMPDWLAEMAEPASPELDDAPRRIELRPTRPPSPPTEAPSRRGNRIYAIVAAMVLALVFFCLLGWLLFSVLGTRESNYSSPSQGSRVITVSAQSPWQSTDVYARKGQVVSIRYMEGTWGVLGGARGAEKQTDAEGFEGEYRSVGLPLTSAPVGALVGRIGNGEPFLVGDEIRFRAGDSGALRLMINDQSLEDNFGALRVEVQVSSAE